ncbi:MULTISPECIES: helix-turn-helix domain-containing protein [unclassified Streptomyces]|uniref:helix-turn-helix domain-containing protein n=1 Tax=unclassified Streptomyces TaxID=2593676 RepID=UPI00093CC93C|nr:helix-turn-helix transcriptional regulator [Streptomyces sp. CB02058]OKI93771.1 DNA-binding protein [Streptomyces sp. CB02058]
MPLPKDLDPYANPRAFYGAELRRLREAAGLSQNELGERAFCSGTYIGLFEAAERRPQVDISRALDELLGSGEHLQRLCRLARTSKVAGYFADAAELQLRAVSIAEHSSMVVPGLLQTESYARALTRAAHPYSSDDIVDTHVRTRMERGRLLDSPAPPLLWVIIHEAALRIPVGGAATMSEQLDHLHSQASTRPRVVVQVLPFSAGATPLLDSAVTLMHFSDAPPAAYTETAYSGQLVEESELVEHISSAYDLARASALSPEASLSLIKSAAKDHATDAHLS